MATRHIPNADEDPTYLGHRIVEGDGFVYSIPVFSDTKKNEPYEKMVAQENRVILIDEIIEKKDMIPGRNPKEILEEKRR